MNTQHTPKTAGWLISSGAILMLVLPLYFVIQRTNEFSTTVLNYLFGFPIMHFVESLNFVMLLSAPRSPIISAFLLWSGIRIIRNKISNPFSLVTYIFGLLMLISLVAEKVLYGYYRPSTLSVIYDSARLLTIIGIGILAYTSYSNIFTEERIMHEQSFSSSSFKTLAGIGRFVEVIGWLAFGVGAIGMLICLVKINEQWAKFMILIWSGAFLLGILIVAQGQIIRCFVSIERNTHETSSAIASLAKRIQTTSTT